jgi:hypothetical protein
LTVKNNHPELITQLTEGIGNLIASDEWRRYLEFQARFHRYSFGNVLLIALQCHEATRVAGFRAWQKMNRPVRRGEKALWILAPMVHSHVADEGEEQLIVRGFKFVPVFDVSQTDGEDLPSVCNRLDGADPAGCFARLVSVAQSIGFAVTSHELNGSANGDCSHAERRIRIEIRNAPAQQVKTLAHEIAHALLHESFESRALAELEAESTAYVVCQALRFDTGGYSFGYVATWGDGGVRAIACIKASCDRIQRAAAAILRAFEPASDQEQAA